MKRLFILLTAALFLTITAAKAQITEPQFKEFAKAFSDSTACAQATVGGYQVLFVTNEYFNDNESGSDQCLVAIAAQLFGLDRAGRIVPFGEVRSQGTAYPIEIKGGDILVSGHHYAERYSISGAPASLVLEESASVTYYAPDKGICNYENRRTGTYKTCKNEKPLDEMMKSFDGSKVVGFTMVAELR